MGIQQNLEDNIRREVQQHGITFSTLQLASAAREMGLLDQIELNHPSKEVRNVIHVSHPDPENPTKMVAVAVEHVSRVLMDDSEVDAYRTQQAAELLLESFKDNPAGLAKLMGQKVVKTKKGSKANSTVVTKRDK